MTLPDPKFAPRRNDLPWLRRRRVKPAPLAAAAAPPVKAAPSRAAPAKTAPAKTAPAKAAPPRPSGGKIDYTRHGREPAVAPPRPTPAPRPTPRQQPAPPEPTPAPAASSGNSLDLSAPSPTPPAPTPPPRSDPAPAPSNSLDLGSGPAPTPAPRPPAPPSSSGDLLDLGGGTPPPPRPPAASTSLDLGGGGGPAGTPRRPTPPPAPTRHHVVRRTRSGSTTLLDFGAPVVTLDRLQSGIGELTVDAVVGDEVGDLRIGAAWALTDGRTGTVELDANRRHGPDDRRPVVWAQKEGRFERIALDLRQSRSLARLLVYAFSPSRQSVTWGGTVVITTYGGDRIDAPVVSAPSPAVLALLTVYNVDGEFVVRSEMDPVAGSVRDTCRAFGYDRISWLDDRTPVG